MQYTIFLLPRFLCKSLIVLASLLAMQCECQPMGLEKDRAPKKLLTAITDAMIQEAKAHHHTFLAEQLKKLQKEDRTNDQVHYINAKGPSHDNTALHEAASAMSDNATIVQALLERGADPNQFNALLETPLYNAVWSMPDDHLGTIDLLLDAGADPLAGTKKWPLEKAISNSCDDIKAVTRMLEKVKNINQQDADGNTLLHYAVYYENVAIIPLLLAKNADPTIANNEPKTPQEMAKYKKQAIRNLFGV